MPSPFDLLSLLLTLSAALAYLNYRLLKLPLTVGLLVGAAAGTLALIAIDAILPQLGLKLQIRSLVEAVDFPATLLNGFLAFLLFAGALQVNSADMFARKWTILALATLATVLSAGLIGAALLGVSMLFGLAIPLAWCLVFGALISPTDPVSVLDALTRVGISRHLQATVAGESLFNDGVGVVLFTLMLSLATSQQLVDFGAGRVGALFLIEAVGGGLLGLALGYAAFLLMRQVDDYNVELIFSLALASGTYSAAGLLGVSGPIAVVVAGILIGKHGVDKAMSQNTRQHLTTFWHLIEGILNAVLFVMIGLEIAAIDLDIRTIAALTLMIPAVLVIRWLSVTASALPLNLRLPRARRYGSLLILTWGGLRGGLSVAMALSLPTNPSKAAILTITYGIVVFSIVVQGLTLERFARRVLPP
ncbi:cation:proton antiporter [Labrys okinawensis]|uniref:cation:proton antiporter n=1 Tax=Labrys okinawensis TaxID=346911 RepID=UPI0039BD2533